MRSRSNAVMIAILLTALALVNACGGGGGSSSGGGSESVKGTFVKTVTAGGTAGTFSSIFSSVVATNHYMFLYLPTDIHGAGNIAAISLSNNASSAVGNGAVTCPNVTIKMGLTSSATLSTAYASNVNNGKGAFATVLDKQVLTIPSTTAGTLTTIELSTPFYYNGVNNLVVDISRAGACSATISNDVHAPTTAYNPVVYNTSATADTATTGLPYNDVVDMRFTFKGGDNAVWKGSPSETSYPFAEDWGRAQVLYLASEISGSGPITGLGFQTSTTTTSGSYTYTLKLGHTTATSLANTFADNFHGEVTTIVTSGTLSIPTGIPAGEYFWIPFPGTFTYNGTDNLLVDIDVSSASAPNYIGCGLVAASIRSVFGSAGSSVGSQSNNAILNAKFRFAGGTMDLITPESGIASFLPTSPVRQQVLYVASELGSSGKITKLACRSAATYSARDYANTKVVMANTSISELSGTYANNIVNGTTVYNGTLSAPAVNEGDWIEIPLSTPFSYDGTSNLVLDMSTDGGPSETWCIAAIDTNRWANRLYQSGYPPSSSVYTMRFWIDK
jgi:hypothetical protein